MTTNAGLLERHHFLFRRLHSLTGIAPIGVFMLAHLLTNSSIAWGVINGRAGEGTLARRVGTFQHEVAYINNMPFLIFIEITLWVSIAFHAILGVYYATTGSNNVTRYGYAGNKRYALQRLSGYIGVLFIFYHVATLRWGWTFLVPGGTEWTAEYSASTMAAVLRGGAEGFTAMGLVVSAFYMLGVSLLVFHLANGLWTAAITWGLTISKPAQRRWGQVCAVIGVVLMGMAWSAVIGFALLDPAQAGAAERSIHAGSTDGGSHSGAALAETDSAH